ncbi:FtsX-like permease family protein [Sulfurimonas aquatica]|uniref:FtsX-like permease family protein n=1 Tax=Sulfurimonas aquatica TaxID=2672570 RepID=A0A975GBH4_9BACT|nr:ABC transporter permease [Sulfurimonas aquatica]QSZ40671.1 FtsX-like permease family protein [Sulfurimonas aquatica]
MIHLAKEDIKHTLGKFLVTGMGVGMLLGIVLIMMGVYRGMIADAEILLDDLSVDLWVVQDNTLGPFAEASRIHEDLKYTLKSIQAIDKSEAITFQNFQLPLADRKLAVLAIGYDVHGEMNPINPERLIAGKVLQNERYEIVVTDKTGYKLNDKVELGRNNFRVVGITHGTVASGGDPIIYISLKDAQELQFTYTNKRIQTDRARGIINKDSHLVNAIIATTKPGYSVDESAEYIRKWMHKSVYTRAQQKVVLTRNVIEKSSKQIGLFTVILIGVATIIIGLIIYTMTLEKMREISIMKLMGLPNSMIIKMIVEETLILGFLAFIFGNIFAHLIYEKFPKNVLLEPWDSFLLLGIVLMASILASFIGVKKVVNADPTAAIGG